MSGMRCRRESVRSAERWLLLIGDALVLTVAAGTSRRAVAVGYDAPEAQHDLTDLDRVEDSNCLVQTPATIEPAFVLSEERFNAIGALHVQAIGRSLATVE